jgi:hypothetical protein
VNAPSSVPHSYWFPGSEKRLSAGWNTQNTTTDR